MSSRRQGQIDQALFYYDPDLKKKAYKNREKISAKDFETIKIMRKEGMSLRAIASTFDIDHTTVMLAIRNRPSE